MQSSKKFQSTPRQQEQKFKELYALFWMDLYRFALHTLGNREDAEDAVQDAVIAAYKNFSSLRDEEKFKSWIFSILVNCCKRKLRSTIKNRNLFENIHLEDKANYSTYSIQDSLDIAREIQNLSEEERIILNLSIYAGYKSKEIGAMLNIPDGTVRSKLQRALQKIKKSFKEAEEVV